MYSRFFFVTFTYQEIKRTHIGNKIRTEYTNIQIDKEKAYVEKII